MTPLPTFSEFFHALWGYEPFPWQAMLAERISTGAWPAAVDLPTASGKTACIEIALYALAAQADRPTSDRTAPRRIWFVVDRRIVVDEAFERAERLAEKLASVTTGPLAAVAARLRTVAGTERPVATARLRGGVFRDDGWARLPSQPAIITSTVDQLGSRILFRGYGHRLLTAPIFAGLAANDSLILLDEAHCSVPFLQTLRTIERLRGGQWAEQPIRTPFEFVIMSATPPADIPPEAVFPGTSREAALNHPVLLRRLYASKPAELVAVTRTKGSSEDPLVARAVERATSYVAQGKRRVAVMVNRVRTAGDVATSLRSALGESADVVLLTGRLRPFDRDILVETWARHLRAAAPESPPKPIVLVSTQSLEVGADFSFDALVTEAASLDALRQRFGRLNRMGTDEESPATVIVREQDRDPAKAEPDPIYGMAIARTWKLLEEHAVNGKVDFGVENFQVMLGRVDTLEPCLAPADDAPLLFPAHLDLLCQTAPPPEPEPEVHLFLHGVNRGAPEVQVVWRADLDPARPESEWLDAVALCPPVSGEMLTVPLHQLRAFLATREVDDPGGDVEGGVIPEGDPGPATLPFLLWRGRDRSLRTRDTRRIRPGDIVVLPASYGFGPLGQPLVDAGVGMNGLDIWERVVAGAGRRVAVRITRATLQQWLDCTPLASLLNAAEREDPDPEDLAACVEEVLAFIPSGVDAAPAPPAWWRDALSRVRPDRWEVHPAGGVILLGPRPTRGEREPDTFADDDDLISAAGTEVSHDDHADLVARTAARTAALCLPVEFVPVFEAAADWHDVGKLDERFQIVLHQGDELRAALATAPLAKSAQITTSPTRRQAIRQAADLPDGFRHEILSLQLAERFAPHADGEAPHDLLLHLIASHHGHARPFAPVVPDPAPPGIRGQRKGVKFELDAAVRASLPPAHALQSGTSDRFWRLVRRYGWWGLAYLEAILRLSDWYASSWTIATAVEAEFADAM